MADPRQRAIEALRSALAGDPLDVLIAAGPTDRAFLVIEALEEAGLAVIDANLVTQSPRGVVFPTLAVSQYLSPRERRALWLSLYAAAFARGLGPDASIVVARGGVAELSAAIVADVPELPSWLREHDDEDDVGAQSIARMAESLDGSGR